MVKDKVWFVYHIDLGIDLYVILIGQGQPFLQIVLCQYDEWYKIVSVFILKYKDDIYLKGDTASFCKHRLKDPQCN